MSVILKQFDGGAIAPRDDAILYNSIITRNGILDGCTITHLGANQLKITAGRGIIKGRMFEVEEMTVNCTLASSGTQRGRMYLRMELSNMENPAQIKTVAADTLPELVQEEDCNYTNGIYELELCTYDVTDTLLSNLETTYEVIDTVFPVAKTLDDVNGVTDENVLAGAVAVKELSSDINTMLPSYANLEIVYEKVNHTDDTTEEEFEIPESGWYSIHATGNIQGSSNMIFITRISVGEIAIAGMNASKGVGPGYTVPIYSTTIYLPKGLHVTISTRNGATRIYKTN